MRLTEYLFLVVIIGVFAYMSLETSVQINDSYPNLDQINLTNLTENYDKIQDIQGDVNSTYENFRKLGDTDTAWYEKIGAGIVAIPYAVIKFPIMIATAITALTSMLFQSMGFLPDIVLLAMVTFLLIEVVKRFLEFFQRSRA